MDMVDIFPVLHIFNIIVSFLFIIIHQSINLSNTEYYWNSILHLVKNGRKELIERRPPRQNTLRHL